MSSSPLFTGQSLATVRICLMVAPAFLLFGYNQSNLGGVVGFDSFTDRWPLLDTANTKGALKTQNSRIQGKLLSEPLFVDQWKLSHQSYCCRHLHPWMFGKGTINYFGRELARSTAFARRLCGNYVHWPCPASICIQPWPAHSRKNR